MLNNSSFLLGQFVTEVPVSRGGGGESENNENEIISSRLGFKI